MGKVPGPMTDQSDTAGDEVMSHVPLPILYGGSANLHTNGRVTLTTCEGDHELSDDDLNALADLLWLAQKIRGTA